MSKANWLEVLDNLPTEFQKTILARAGHSEALQLDSSISEPPGQSFEEMEPPASQNTFARTDLGNAERLVNRYKDVIRYCPTHKSWSVWDSRCWRQDTAGRIYYLARKVVRAIPMEADQFPDGDPMRVEILKHAARSEGKERIEAMIKLAQHDPAVTIEPEQFDRNPWLLNLQNGVLDLKIGILRPHWQEDFISKICPIDYVADADCPRWKQFLNEIFRSHELISYIQKLCGYILTGHTKEQEFYLFHGRGANGKSTFIRVLMDLLGRDYSKQTASTALLIKHTETAGEEIAVLEGTRLAVTVEVDDGKRLAESLVKQLSGGDRVRVRRLYANSFEFQPTFKLVMVCNHRPRVLGTDSGIWRRIRLIPFDVEIPEHKQDRDLVDKLRQELSGILNWCIAGCLRWQEEGLIPPEIVDAATTSYRVESDTIGAFLDECTVTSNNHARIQASSLYECYKTWTEAAGEYPLSMRRFNDRLRERGFQCLASTGNRKYWQGIGLIDEFRSDWAEHASKINTSK